MFFKSNNLVQYILLSLLFLSVATAKERPYLCNSFTDDFQLKSFGDKKTNITIYPMVAAIVAKKSSLLSEDMLQCGCGIITEKWVLTAAHCVIIVVGQKLGVGDIYVAAGHNDWRKGHKHNVTHMITHKQYNADSMENDIALIHVKNPFNEKLEVPWPLASKNYPYKPNTLVTVLGWGLEDPSNKSPRKDLEFVKIHIFDQTHCKDEYAKQNEVVTNTQFCAGERNARKDSCRYNSGGPLIDGTILIGIVSWGITCGEIKGPGVYTKVSLFEKWIVDESEKIKDAIVTKCTPEDRIGYFDNVHFSRSAANNFNKKTLFVIPQMLFIFTVNVL